MLGRLRRYLRRRKYKVGAKLSRVVWRDIRRDVEIIDAAELEQGYVTARIRTWDLRYVAYGVGSVPPFEEPRRVAIAQLWEWADQTWDGPVPDDDISRPRPDR